MIELFFMAQNHHQPWHEPYVGQLVTCKPDPKRPDIMIGEYTFSGSEEKLPQWTFKRDPKGCPLTITIQPRPKKAT